MEINAKVCGLLLVVVVVAGGCGNADSDGPSAGPAEGAGTTTTAAEPAASTIANAAQLRLSDLPAGWEQQRGEEAQDDDEDEAAERRIAACIGVDYERIYGDKRFSVDSPTFESPNDQELSSSAGVTESEEEARFVFDTLTSAEATECIAAEGQSLLERLASESGESFTVGQVTVNRLSFRDFGDQSAAFRVTIPVEAGDVEVDAHLDVVVVRYREAGVTMQAFSLLSPFDAEELARYTEIVVGRLIAAVDAAAS